MATIVHFNLDADQPERARSFYEQLFGWNFISLPGNGDYLMIETKGIDGKPGLGGGMSKRTTHNSGGITNFIGVISIDDTLEDVIKFGGTIVVPRQTVPGFGYNALCTDTEGNILGLFQEDRNAGQ